MSQFLRSEYLVSIYLNRKSKFKQKSVLRFTCLKPTIETLEKEVKFVLS